MGVELNCAIRYDETKSPVRIVIPQTHEISLTFYSCRPQDSTSNLQKRDDAQSSTTAGAGTPVAALPSGYIPSDQRVKSNDAAESKTSSLPVPSINVEATASDDDKGKTEFNMFLWTYRQ